MKRWGEIKLAIHRVKIISHNVSRIKEPDDPSYPYRLEAVLAHPEFHGMAMTLMFRGPEELVVLAKSERGIRWIIRLMDLRNNKRLQALTLITPQGEVDMLKR